MAFKELNNKTTSADDGGSFDSGDNDQSFTASESASNALQSANSASTALTAKVAAETAKTNAETAQTNAETAQTAAEAAQAAAELALDTFDDRYLGAKSTSGGDPTVDNDGNALIDGALFFDTTNNITKVYNLGTTTWLEIGLSGSELTNVNTVASISSDITTVAGISSDVTNVVSNNTNITTVAGISANVTTVSGISSDVTTLAGISSDVTTAADNDANITTVAGISSNVTTVAGVSSDVTSVAGISANVTSVAGVTSDVTTVAGISGNVSTVAGISSDVATVAADGTNIGTVAGISSNITTVAGDSADIQSLALLSSEIGLLGVASVITDMSILGTADVVNDMNVLGTSANVTAMNLLGTSDVVNDMNVLGTSDVVNDMNVLGTAATVTAMNLLGTSAVVTDMSILGTADVVADMNVLGTTANVTAMNVLGTSANVTAMSTVSGSIADVTAVAADSADIGTVATDLSGSDNIGTVAGSISNVNNVGGSIANVNTVANNLASVNSFGETYRIAASDPTTSLDEGDLYFDTTNNVMKVYDGSAWVAAYASLSGSLSVANNLSDLSSASTARTNLGLGSAATTAATAYATAAQGTTADAALPKAGGAMTGPITTNSTFDGVDIAARDAVLTTTTTTANAALPKAGGAMTGPITTNSTFDGRAVATDGAKLDNITVTQAVDLDQMEIDIAALANGMVYKGDWDASSGSFPGSGSAQVGWFYYVSVAGTVGGVSFSVGDNIVAIADNASTSTYAGNWSKHDQTDAVTAVVGLNGSITKSGLLSALNVEDGADVTDATNVTAAGALMDSEVTNLAQVKAFDSTDYATAAQGTTADAALPKAGGTMTGDITFGANKATFGTGGELQVYDDGTSSVITSSGNSAKPLKFQRTHTGSFIPSFTFEGVSDSIIGPLISLKHETASPSTIDSAYIQYDSKNTAAEDINYAQINFRTMNVTDGIEEGRVIFNTKNNGADKTLLVINGSNADVEIGDDGAVLLSNGTTAQRPSTGQNGMLRYNTDDAQFEGYADGAWGAIAGGGGGGDTQTATTTSITETAIATYTASSSLGIEITVVATDTVATERTITKLLVTHDGTTAVATEYGGVNTATTISSYDVDISGGDVRLLATAASANSTNFTVSAVVLA